MITHEVRELAKALVPNWDYCTLWVQETMLAEAEGILMKKRRTPDFMFTPHENSQNRLRHPKECAELIQWRLDYSKSTRKFYDMVRHQEKRHAEIRLHQTTSG